MNREEEIRASARNIVEPWEEIVPIEQHEVPAFPIEIFSNSIRSYLQELSASIQVPIDLPAMLAIATAATAIQRKVEIHIIGDFVEPLNVYVDCVLPSGERKSTTYRMVREPIDKYVQSIKNELRDTVRSEESELRVKESKVKYLENALAKAKIEKEQDLQINLRLAREDLDVFSNGMAKIPRITTDNITTEKLIVLMAENDERMAMMSADTDMISIINGRYSGMCDIAFLLNAYSGDIYQNDRMTREVEIEKPTLTIAFTTQPSLLKELSSVDGANERGLIARFWYSVPKSMVGERLNKPVAISEQAKKGWHDLVTTLLEIKINKDNFNKIVPIRLELTEDAKDLYWCAYKNIEKKRGEYGSLTDLPGNWQNKCEGTIARATGLLHIMNNIDDWGSKEVEVGTVKDALKLTAYLIKHARLAGSLMGIDTEEISGAKKILKWIKDNKKKEFTKRELYQSLRRQFGSKASNLNSPLRFLEDDCGVIRRKKTNNRREGYEVNPDIK